MRPLALAERGIPTSVSLADLLSGQRPAISGSTDIALPDYVDIRTAQLGHRSSTYTPHRGAW